MEARVLLGHDSLFQSLLSAPGKGQNVCCGAGDRRRALCGQGQGAADGRAHVPDRGETPGAGGEA